MNNFLKNLFSFLVIALSFQAFAKNLPIPKTPNFMTLQNISESPIGFNGFNVKSYTFTSSRGNKDIVKFYKKAWKDKIKTMHTPQWIYHTTFDGKFLTVVQVRAQAQAKTGSFSGSSKVTGLISVSEPGAIKEKDIVKVEMFYPMSPGTKKLSDITATDMGKHSRTTVFDRPGSVGSNLAYFKTHFKDKGWGEVQENMAEAMVREFGGSTLIMQQGGDELVISFIPDKGRTKVVSVLVRK
jgi:hypothetical protein